ncbi:MAG: protein-L-isoaspartate O-methyltransferase family protein [Sandaracinobacteroides sp.]
MASAVPASLLAAREAMIDSQLKPCGVVSPHVVAAFLTVAREDFVPAGRRALSYVDAAQPIGSGRELLAPLSLGTLIEDAQPQPADNVLVIGAGTGYSAAILSELAGSVTAVECESALAASARGALAGRTTVRVHEGPLQAGAPDGAPYSLILIDGGIEVLPDELVAQLAEGGRLFTILHGADGVGRAARGRKQAGVLLLEPFAECVGTVLPTFQRPQVFRF